MGVRLMPGTVGGMDVGVPVSPVTGILLSDLIARANSKKCMVSPEAAVTIFRTRFSASIRPGSCLR
ncbi:MAG: hypothetical protein AB1649_27630 [Chloroflexota bacterium]